MSKDVSREMPDVAPCHTSPPRSVAVSARDGAARQPRRRSAETGTTRRFRGPTASCAARRTYYDKDKLLKQMSNFLKYCYAMIPFIALHTRGGRAPGAAHPHHLEERPHADLHRPGRGVPCGRGPARRLFLGGGLLGCLKSILGHFYVGAGPNSLCCIVI